MVANLAEFIERRGVIRAPGAKTYGGVATVVPLFRVAEDTSSNRGESTVRRTSVYPYKGNGVPGENVHRLRTEREWSQRELADHCKPALDHTTIRRLEYNEGYTQDTLERVAVALRVRVADLFLPPELIGWSELSAKAKGRIEDAIDDALTAERARKTDKPDRA